MDIYWLQHVPFEGLGSIRPWAENKGHNLIATRLWAEDKLPEPDDVSMLIIMGGPMGVDDETTFSWLAEEKKFIARVVDRNRPVMGICLGAQLLAAVLGAEVYRNRGKEIGWFPVKREERAPPPFNAVFPGEMDVFHWHGDTFDLPVGGRLLGSSEACHNQAFIAGDRILGLQYHLEMTPTGLSGIIAHCGDELVHGDWIQTEEEIIGRSDYLIKSTIVMERILNTFEILAEKG
jgi:GMP synthase-like glutamine amidotransferase